MAGTKIDVEEAVQAPKKPYQSYNTYATKKTLASGLMDIALIMANATQLKSLLDVGPGQDYYYALLILIILSLLLQVVVGIIMIVLGSIEVHTAEEKRHVHILNDVTIAFILAVTLLNVFIGAFGIKLSEN